MIVLIEHNNGESYEDYATWIERAYSVNTKHDLKKKHVEFVVELFRELKIAVHPEWLNLLEGYINPKNTKLHKKIITDNKFESWLLSNYKCKLVEFQVVEVDR